MSKSPVTVAWVSSVILIVMFRFRTLMVGALVISGVFINAQTTRPTARTTSAETGLVGIKLYDTGTRVVNMYGSPDEILALGSASSGSGGGSGGSGGGRPGSGGGGGNERTGASGDFSVNRPSIIGDPFGTGETEFRQLRPQSEGREGGGGGGGMTTPGSDASAGGGGNAGAGGGGNNDRVIFTRWVYKRANAHYGFVFDKFNRVVQIEALGLKDSKVRTRKGITFDMHFNDLIKKYGAPDAYEINGDNIVVRYLVKDRVAFRLSRTRPNTPHHVTGVVVAAGKA